MPKSNEQSSAMSANNGTSPCGTKENVKKELTILHYNDVRINYMKLIEV